MLGSYRFRYRHGQSMPYATLLATDDADFFNNKIPAWERKTGFKYVPYTVTCTVYEYRKVPEPAKVSAPATEQPRPEYLLHTKKMADPSKPYVF